MISSGRAAPRKSATADRAASTTASDSRLVLKVFLLKALLLGGAGGVGGYVLGSIFAFVLGPQLAGMLIYSATITLYLAYLGLADGFTGILLWPAVVVHVILTVLLTREAIRTLREARR